MTPTRNTDSRDGHDAGRRRACKLALAAPWIAGLGGLPAAASAHGPTPQRIDESIEIAAPPAAVWALVGSFADFARWNPTLASSSADKGNEQGSRRELKTRTGGTIAEELDDYDATALSMSYRSARDLDTQVMPTSSYSARLRVTPVGSGSKLEWQARCYRADTGNEPPKGKDDATAVAAMKAHIRPALEAAKQQLEKG